MLPSIPFCVSVFRAVNKRFGVERVFHFGFEASQPADSQRARDRAHSIQLQLHRPLHTKHHLWFVRDARCKQCNRFGLYILFSCSLFLSSLRRCRRQWRIVSFLFIFPTDVSIFHNFYRMCINCRKSCCKRRRQHNASKGIPHNGGWIVGERKKKRRESNVLCVHSRAQNITINWKEKRNPNETRIEKDRSSGRCVRRRCSMTLMNSITEYYSIRLRWSETINHSTRKAYHRKFHNFMQVMQSCCRCSSLWERNDIRNDIECFSFVGSMPCFRLSSNFSCCIFAFGKF